MNLSKIYLSFFPKKKKLISDEEKCFDEKFDFMIQVIGEDKYNEDKASILKAQPKEWVKQRTNK